jgi:hypothetical protein
MRIAVDAAREDIGQMLSMLLQVGPVPDRMWRDPYVIGYLASLGGMAAEVVTDGRLSEKHLTKAAFRALGALAGKPAQELRAVVENGTEEALAEFEEGFLAAYKVAAVACGDDQFDGDPDVTQARQFVAQHKSILDQGGLVADETARTVATLESALFVTYVAETYYPEDARAKYTLAVQTA